jgi:asparagine synthase (glutamine-hydrolysing)
MDTQVAEFAARLPVELKLHGRSLKYIQRRVAAEFLPEPLLRRRKQGFGFPLAYWFRNELRDLTSSILLNSSLVDEGYFQPAAIKTLLDEHVSGRMDHNYRLWLLLNLELWHRMFIGGSSLDELSALLQKGGDRGATEVLR